ncbi:alpha-ribazole phosphatase [Hasllibacter halocynthiae]|uniref:Alpha-ribazole phosphatase n=1 Tax=Hasllibacter halocynthiae TaxID=595589 RepID=A0A2T0X458_9RHOB|nr:histidine phosphatase family protein [Hasllibacter halocynthiae]PRY93697.1 alpha-ribazole phosphatase [Hasllibacter halocynthiae]
MPLTFLRHPPPDVARGVCYGASDLALLPGWEEAIDALQVGATAVRHSPLGRCAGPARRLAARLGVRAVADPGLREMDFGAWEMRPWDAVPRGQIDAWAADTLHWRPPGGETVAEMAARVAAALERAGEGELWLSHAGVFKALRHLAGAPGPWDERIGFGEVRTL